MLFVCCTCHIACFFHLQYILSMFKLERSAHALYPDYFHLTKRFGIIAASQLPLHYALALKSWSPIHYLTRLTHEELNPYHRLLGRIIVTFFALHASMYLNFYVQKGLLLKRIRDWDVIFGLTAIITALLLNTAALSKIREWNYRVFFYTHVVLSIALLPILYLHVSHLRAYILEAAAIYIILIIQRNASQTSANATITQLPNTNLLSITIPLPTTCSLATRKYTPGQHIYLGFPSLPQKLRINPFSIVNPSPSADGKIHLVARKLNGTTALLADLATNNKNNNKTTPLLIEGPYGSATYFPDLMTFDRVLFVAGGAGATFTLPLFIDLLQRRAAVAEQWATPPVVKFVWSVRQEADAKWGVELLQEQLGEKVPVEEIEICVTGKSKERSDPLGKHQDDDKEEIELQEHQPLMDGTSTTSPTTTNQPTSLAALPTKTGRPNLRSIIGSTFNYPSLNKNDKTAILVCGPTGMGAQLRREAGRYVAKGREVFWHGEDFGW